MNGNNELLIPGVDCASGIARFANKKDLYLKSLKNFVSSIPEIHEPFSSLSSEDSITKFHGYVHTQKGVCGNLSMTDMYEATIEFEKKLKEHNFCEEDYENWYKTCLETKNTVLEVLKSMNFSAAPQISAGSKDKCISILTELYDALENFQTSKCEKLVSELRTSRWSGFDETVIAKIVRDVESYDYDGAAEKIKPLIV